MRYPADLRPPHRRVLAEIAMQDEISRNDLTARLELPRATVTSLVRDLIARGLVVTRESAVTGRRGRPAEILALAGPATVIGVLSPSADGLRVAVVTVSGRIVAADTHSISRADFRLDTATELLGEVAGRAGYALGEMTRVVLSLPAPYQRGVGSPASRSYAPWALGDPAGELAERTGTRVLIENDANLSALGEHRFGAGRGKQSLVHVMLGERSVGAGLIINGWLHRGATGFAGELAHIQIDDDGPLCSCGGRGCLIHTGTALLRSAQSAYDEPLTYPRILALANAGDGGAGDPGMARLLGDFGRSVGRPLADTTTMLNPEAIIVGGATGAGGRHIVDGIREAVNRYAAPPAAAAVEVLAGETGDHADLLGAVVLARHEADR